MAVVDGVFNGSSPGAMTVYSGRVSLLTVSLTVNCCTLSFFIIRDCLNQLAMFTIPTSCCRRSTLVNLAKLHRDNQWMLPKILVEQLLSWTLIFFGVIEMARWDILDNPFVPNPSRDLTLSGTAFCMNIGKYVYKMAQDTILIRRVKRYKVDMLHHVVTVACYAAFQAYNENVLLGLVGLLMESDLIWRDIATISKRTHPGNTSLFHKRVIVLGGVATVVVRGALPTAFVTLALVSQPLTRMQFASIIFFFLSLIFFLAVNVWMVVRAALRIRQVYKRKLPASADVELTEVPSIVHRLDTTGSDGTNNPSIQRSVPTGHVIPLSVKNDLSYLRPYANTNIANNTEDDKLNLMNKKTLSKPMVGDFHLNNYNNNAYVVQPEAGGNVVSNGNSGESSPRSNSSAELYSVGQNVRIGFINIETRANETGQGVHHVVIPVSDGRRQPDTERSPTVLPNS